MTRQTWFKQQWLDYIWKEKNSSDEHILIALVAQSHCATSDPWPLTFDPVAHFKDGVQEKNSHNSVGDGRAVEYYFASDARWDTLYLCFVVNPVYKSFGLHE